MGRSIPHRVASYLLAHNHPSGYAEPSPQDADFTRAMVDVGGILNIDVLDHLIPPGATTASDGAGS
ncbi:MAG: JAB domain-containing protein [Candidatus Dormibacteraceae bacterium]